jgi:phosphatidylglycerol---prolipoprotein diacylglyceryl transferase
MYIHNFNPNLIDFGFITIKWYSLSYIVGILAGWWLGKIILNSKSGDDEKYFGKEFDDLITYTIISIIIGGRLGYVLFYNFSYYASNPIDILKIWEGGMSFHGALLGIAVSTFIFSKFNKIKTFFWLDIIACVSPIGLFFGRIANFINAELYGKPTDIFWSVIFPNVDSVPRHPSQLYEAFMEGIVLFTILILFIFKKNYKTGFCSFLFLSLYGLFRIIAELFREPDKHIGYVFGSVSMGTLLSIVMVIVGTVFLLKLKKNEFK